MSDANETVSKTPDMSDPPTTLELRAKAVAEQDRLFPSQTWRAAHGDGTAENPIRTWTHRPTLPEICLHLRASINGASDPLPNAFLEECRLMLKARVDSWLTSKSTIDDAVKLMCVATGRMIRQELETRAEKNFVIQ